MEAYTFLCANGFTTKSKAFHRLFGMYGESLSSEWSLFEVNLMSWVCHWEMSSYTMCTPKELDIPSSLPHGQLSLIMSIKLTMISNREYRNSPNIESEKMRK